MRKKKPILDTCIQLITLFDFVFSPRTNTISPGESGSINFKTKNEKYLK